MTRNPSTGLVTQRIEAYLTPPCRFFGGRMPTEVLAALEWENHRTSITPFAAVKGFAASSLGLKIFLVGAIPETATPRSGAPSARDGRMAVVEIDTESMHGKELVVAGTPPPAVTAHSAAIHLNLMLVFGGITMNTQQFTSNCFGFDLASKTWLFLRLEGLSPAPRASHSAVMHDSCMFVFGGRDALDGRNDLHMLHLHSMAWEQVEACGSVPSPRYAHSCAVSGSQMLVYGGCRQGRFLNDLYELNLGTGVWSVLDLRAGPAAMPGLVMFPAACVFMEELFVMGNDGSFSIDLLESVCMRANEAVISKADIPLVLTGPQLLAVHQRLHLLDQGVWVSARIPDRHWEPLLHRLFPWDFQWMVSQFLHCVVHCGYCIDVPDLYAILGFLSCFDYF